MPRPAPHKLQLLGPFIRDPGSKGYPRWASVSLPRGDDAMPQEMFIQDSDFRPHWGSCHGSLPSCVTLGR